ncbi:MAG: hypothetical protein ACOVO1_12840 [Chitinophagaceae bacterium]
MKKNNTIQRVFLVLFAALTMFSCQKKDEAAAKSGSFTVDGTTYTGPCAAIVGISCTTGKDVIISTANANYNFTISSMPPASSGTFNFTDGYYSSGTCNLYGAYTPPYTTANDFYATSTGTLTKTGANSFTFSCTTYNLLTNIKKTVTGSGNY